MSGGPWVVYAEARSGKRLLWREEGSDVWRNSKGERVIFDPLSELASNGAFVVDSNVRSPACVSARRRSARAADRRLEETKARARVIFLEVEGDAAAVGDALGALARAVGS